MRYASTLVIALAALLLGCEDKAKPKAEAPAPDQGRTIARLPEPEPEAPVAPRPKPVVRPAPAEPEPPTPPAPLAAEGTYVVQKGDTLWSIAKRQLGDGQRWKDIVAANRGLTAEKLKVGQTIKLPAK